MNLFHLLENRRVNLIFRGGAVNLRDAERSTAIATPHPSSSTTRKLTKLNWLLAVVPAVSFGAITYSPGPWTLHRANAVMSATYTSSAACNAALRAQPVDAGKNIAFSCEQLTMATGVAATPPVTPPVVTPPVVTPPVVTPPVVTLPAGSNCGMQFGGAAMFCETFDAPKATSSRSGDLDANVWGVSRAIGGGVNFGQGMWNQWNQTALVKCDGSTVRSNAPKDIIICNGQLREASNDNNSLTFDAGDVTILAMYPKQPFDFAGRIGTASFDVSNDTAGIHAAWPEFWLSDLPVPIPFNHFDSWQSTPQNGFGIRMAAQAPVGQYGGCPNGNNLDKLRWTVDSAVVVRNYVMEDHTIFDASAGMRVQALDCVVMSTTGQMNHVEIRVSQSQIDVYATDAGTTTPLKHIAVITNANLTLTRGLIWLEDVHYNADKSGMSRPSQREHTFAWDNVAFDGPFTYRDFSFDALDNTATGANGSRQIGKLAQPNGFASWDVLGLPANRQAAVARVLFSFNGEFQGPPTKLNVTVNGHAHSVPWPYPANTGFQNTWRTYAFTVPLTDLVTGTNVVQIGADSAIVSSNVNIVLVNVPGGVPVLPGSNNAYPN